MEYDMNLKNVLDMASRSDTGRLRLRNEDRIGADLKLGLVVLADGTDGHHGGDVASTIAVNAILEDLKTSIPGITPGQIDAATGYSRESLAARQAVIKANNMIYKTAQAEPQYRGMGTTLVMAIFYDNRVTVVNVGDSRMYRFRDDRLEQVTLTIPYARSWSTEGFVHPWKPALL
jgi:PPM family protein phosphatase